MIEPVFFATVENGKLLFSQKELLQTHILSFEGQDVDVIIRKHKKVRTQRQNRYYWIAVVGIPAKHFWYLPEEMHDCFKMMFLRKHEEGKPETVKSTTGLTTVEFNEYVEKCCQWCAENGIVIPQPEISAI